jgi:hypothetical protein
MKLARIEELFQAESNYGFEEDSITRTQPCKADVPIEAVRI